MPLLRLSTVWMGMSAWLIVGLTERVAVASSLTIPVVFAKSWAVGYAIFGLAVLLGLLAVTITSKRKTIRRRDG